MFDIDFKYHESQKDEDFSYYYNIFLQWET